MIASKIQEPQPPPAATADATSRFRVIYSEPNQQPPHDAQSPSLGRETSAESSAYELKFLLSEAQARDVEELLRGRLALDPHADPTLGNGYHISTLYCDTPERHVLRRVGRYRRFKLRFRRYGADDRIFLERKSKQGEEVRKRRTTIELGQVSRLAAAGPDADWDAAWYHRRLIRNRLSPVCLIEYRRVAYFGRDGKDPIRLTFDREIFGGPTTAWSFSGPERREPILADRVICEFKFRGWLPAPFKAAIQQLQLTPVGVSKYRQCLATAGAAEPASALHA